MSNYFEYDIVQNNALGAIAIWSFCNEYYKSKDRSEGPPLILTMPVLPIVFNQSAVSYIYNRQKDGGLFKAVAEDKLLTVGLQQRMESMADQTFESLNIAFSGNMLNYDRETTQLIPKRGTPAITLDVGDVKKILSASRRLGYWFANLSIEQVCYLLKVRF